MIAESAYYIAKNASTLHVFRVELLLLPTRFQIEDAIASALSIKRSYLFISPTCYCRSSTYQEGAGVQEYDINTTRELHISAGFSTRLWSLCLTIYPTIRLLFRVLLVVFPFVGLSSPYKVLWLLSQFYNDRDHCGSRITDQPQSRTVACIEMKKCL